MNGKPSGKLEVASKAHHLVLSVYKTTARFPKHEQFGLVSQMRRSAVSIPANLHEGKARGSDAELCRFINIARASLAELRYFLLLSKDLDYLTEGEFHALEAQSDEIARMMSSLLEKVTKEIIERSKKRSRSKKAER